MSAKGGWEEAAGFFLLAVAFLMADMVACCWIRSLEEAGGEWTGEWRKRMEARDKLFWVASEQLFVYKMQRVPDPNTSRDYETLLCFIPSSKYLSIIKYDDYLKIIYFNLW